MLVRRIARPLLSVVFIGQGVDALRSPQQAADAARPTVEGLKKLPEPAATKVPTDPETLARVNALVQIGGGLLLASGKLPRLASAALACTVIPGSLGGHMFWTESDPSRKAQQRRDFLTDLSLIGGLMIASVDTEGKPSLGWRGRRAARRAGEVVSAALPLGAAANGSALEGVGEKLSQRLQTGAERGRELAEAATEKAGPLLETVKERSAERGRELAEVATEKAGPLLETVKERSAELAELTRDRGAELAKETRKRSKKTRKRFA